MSSEFGIESDLTAAYADLKYPDVRTAHTHTDGAMD